MDRHHAAMSDNKKSGLGPVGLLALVCLIVGALSVGVYALQAFDIADVLPKGEGLKKFVLFLVLGAPAAAALLGFLGSKYSDSKSAAGKCMGIALGGVVLLGVIGWMIFGMDS